MLGPIFRVRFECFFPNRWHVHSNISLDALFFHGFFYSTVTSSGRLVLMWNLARTLMSWSNFVQASRGHRSFSWSLWTAESDRLGTWWFCDLERLKGCHPEQLSKGWNGEPHVSRFPAWLIHHLAVLVHHFNCEDRTLHHPSWPKFIFSQRRSLGITPQPRSRRMSDAYWYQSCFAVISQKNVNFPGSNLRNCQVGTPLWARYW